MSVLSEIWELSSYAVQLILAAAIIAFCSNRRSYFVARYLLSSVIFLTFSILITINFEVINSAIGMVGFWALFTIGVTIIFYFCCEFRWSHAIYYTIITLAIQHVAFDLCEIFDSVVGRFSMCDFIIYALIYVFAYFTIRKVFSNSQMKKLNASDILPITTIMLVVLFVSVEYKTKTITDESYLWNVVCYRIVDALCCAYILWTQLSRRQSEHFARELAGINQAFLLQKEQYMIRQEIIDSINRKCHDLKHQLEAVYYSENPKERAEYFQELKKDLMIYDMTIETGNEALNLLVMDKGRYCLEHGIQFSCMADAGSLDFMKLEDVYAMFGNAIDNAIAAVEKLTDNEKRVVTLKVLNQNNLLMIQVQNYYDQPIKFENGIPLTTKKDKTNHGFGVKSIQYIAEKYDGTMTISAKNNVFILQILLPINR